MNEIIPLKALYDASDNPIGLSEMQVDDVLPVSIGGTGVSSYLELFNSLGLKDLSQVQLSQLITDLESKYGFFTQTEVSSYLTTNNFIDQNAIGRLVTLEVLKYLSALTEKTDTTKYTFNTPVSIWRIPHGRNTVVFEQELYSFSEYGVISPFNAKKIIIDENTVEYHLSKPMTGYVNMTFHDSVYQNCLYSQLDSLLNTGSPSTLQFISGVKPYTTSQPDKTFVFIQPTSSDIWTISYDLTGLTYSIFVYDDLDRIYNVTPVSTQNGIITLQFSSPVSGRAIIYFDDYKYEIGPKFQEVSRYIFNSPMLVWRVEHNLKSRHLDCELYSPDNYGNSPFKAKEIIVDENVIEYHLTKPLAGYVDIVFSDLNNSVTEVVLS